MGRKKNQTTGSTCGSLFPADLCIIPLSLREANNFVLLYHRHHKPVVGMKFAVGVMSRGEIVGVAIAGRPVSRHLDDGLTLEINRTCTDGTPNANSKLYGTVTRIGKEMGYRRIITYTLPEESGASLRAVGWRCDGEAGGGNWNCPTRPRQDSDLQGRKLRWVREF